MALHFAAREKHQCSILDAWHKLMYTRLQSGYKNNKFILYYKFHILYLYLEQKINKEVEFLKQISNECHIVVTLKWNEHLNHNV